MGLYDRLGVKTYITAGGNGTANGGSIMWPQAVCDELRQGEPGIIIPALPTGLMLSPQCLEPGEEAIVAKRLRDVLHAA